MPILILIAAIIIFALVAVGIFQFTAATSALSWFIIFGIAGIVGVYVLANRAIPETIPSTSLEKIQEISAKQRKTLIHIGVFSGILLIFSLLFETQVQRSVLGRQAQQTQATAAQQGIRANGLVTKVQISRTIVSDQPSGETGPVLYGKGPLAVYFEYDGDQVQRGDTAQVVLAWSGGESACKSQQLTSSQRNGWGWCKWDSIEIDKYDVFIAINGHRTRKTAVEIASQESRRQADAALQAQQEAENRSRLLEESARLEEERKQAQEMLTTGDECDQSAGNALDQNRNRSFAGVAYPILRNNAAVAIAKCRAAVAQNPGTPRFRYQLARALQTLKNPEAKALLAELTRQRYPAAFDNLGWLHHNERDYRQAANYFRSGVQMNDPESMVSLAGYLLEGRFITKDEREAMRLLTEAEKYGHPTAVRAMNEYRQQQRLKAAGIQILSSVLRQILEVR